MTPLVEFTDDLTSQVAQRITILIKQKQAAGVKEIPAACLLCADSLPQSRNLYSCSASFA
jgi:hypothetical protein